MWGNVLCHYGSGSYHAVAAYGDSGQYDGVGTYPHIVADDDGARRDALLVDALGGIEELVVQRRDDDALRQIDVAADAHRTDDGVVDADAGVVANGDVTHGIVDAAVRLDDAVATQTEAAIGWGVHSDAGVNLRPASAILVERGQQADVPSRPGVALVHDDEVEPALQLRTAFQFLSEGFLVFHAHKNTTISSLFQIFFLLLQKYLAV